MQPTPISSLLPGGSTKAPTIAPTGKDKTLGRQDFLQLLVSQLKNQDPLNPMQGAEFSAQLAQFSSVEQLVELNKGFTGLMDATAQGSKLSQTALATSLIGRDVTAAGNAMTVDPTTGAQVTVNVGGATQLVTVRILGPGGKVLDSHDFGALSAGTQKLSWQPQGVAAGNYTYDVVAQGQDGATVPVTSLATGTVKGITFKNGQIMLDVGGTMVPFDALVNIG